MPKFLITTLVLFFSLNSKAALVVSAPEPSNNIIDFSTTSIQTIYITNTGTVAENLNLSFGNTKYTVQIDRCSGKSIKAKSNCYITLAVKANEMVVGENLTSISNSPNALTNLTTLKYTKAGVVETSNFTVNSLNMTTTSNYTLSITNKTLSNKSYAPTFSGTHASKFEIVLNRCTNIAPQATCLIYVRLKPQPNGTYTASLSEAQVTGSVALSATLTTSTIGAQPLVKALTITPAGDIDFGTITKIGFTSTRTIYVNNTGNVEFIPDIEPYWLSKIILNRCKIVLKPGKTCELQVAINTQGSANHTLIEDYITVSTPGANPVSAVKNLIAYLEYPEILPTSCPSGQHIDTWNGTMLCESDLQACSSIPQGQVDGQEVWDPVNQWFSGLCEARSQSDCDTGYTYNAQSKSCFTSMDLGTIPTPSSFPAGYSLQKDVNENSTWGNPHQACVVSSLNPFYGSQTFQIVKYSSYNYSSSNVQLSENECDEVRSLAIANTLNLNINISSGGADSYCSVSDVPGNFNYYVISPNQQDAFSFCRSLWYSTVSYQNNVLNSSRLFVSEYSGGMNNGKMLEFDSRLFYTRLKMKLEWNKRTLSSTNGTNGNSIDHLPASLNVRADSLVVFDNKLYIRAETYTDNGPHAHRLYRLNNSSEVLTEASSYLFEGHFGISKVGNILLIDGIDSNEQRVLAYIEEGSSTVHYLNLDLGSPSHTTYNYTSVGRPSFVKVGNKLYRSFKTWSNNAQWNDAQYPISVFDLTTGDVVDYENLEVTSDFNKGRKVFELGSKKYAIAGGKLYEINSDQSTTLIQNLSGYFTETGFGPSTSDGKIMIRTSSVSDYYGGTVVAYLLDSSNSSISTLSSNFPSYAEYVLYNEASSKFVYDKWGSGLTEMDQSGNELLLSADHYISSSQVGYMNNKLFFVGNDYDYLFSLDSSNNLNVIPQLCSNPIYNSYNGQISSFNNKIYLMGNSCQGEALQIGGSYNNQQMFEFFKYSE